MSKRDLCFLVAGVLAIGIFLGVALSCALYIYDAEAEGENLLYYCWTMCQPDSEVVIREKPNKKSAVIGAVSGGTCMVTDGIEKDGWIHLVDIANESGEGWISSLYVVYSEVRTDRHIYPVKANGRVACRKFIEGTIRCWVQDEEELTVYLVSSEWCVTNKGFVLTKFIDFGNRVDIQNMDPDEMTWEED